MDGGRFFRVLIALPLLSVSPVWSVSTAENRDGLIGSAHEATSKVAVAAHAIAYCETSGNCTYTRVLFTDQTPIAFTVQLESEPGAKNEPVDIGIRMWNWDRTEIVFETNWSTSIEYVPSQISSMTYEDWPGDLNEAQDARYRLMAFVANKEGSIYDASEIPIFTSSSTERSGTAATDQVNRGCVTLETGEDNGFIQCIADQLNPAWRNGTTEEAFRNLDRCLAAPGHAAIIGHGASGLICTGDGDKCSDPWEVIRHNNEASWRPDAARVRDQMSTLTLAACKPGAGSKGSHLLYRMAQVTNASVSGPTGDIWCHPKKGIWIEGYWKTATPNQRPARRDVAEEPDDLTSNGEDAVVVIDAVPRVVRLNDVEVVAIVLRVDGEEHNIGTRLDLGDNIHRLIALGTPEITISIPGALITGHLEIRMLLEERSVSKTYRILANSRLQDTEDTTFYYRLDRRLEERLEELAEELREEE